MRLLLPDGFVIHARVLQNPSEQIVGLMGIPKMPEDFGALFCYREPGLHPHWMQGCLFPVDMAWLDEEWNVVEVAGFCSPCPTPVSEYSREHNQFIGSGCPSYGGSVPSRYCLEVNAGILAQHGVTLGSQLRSV